MELTEILGHTWRNTCHPGVGAAGFPASGGQLDVVIDLGLGQGVTRSVHPEHPAAAGVVRVQDTAVPVVPGPLGFFLGPGPDIAVGLLPHRPVLAEEHHQGSAGGIYGFHVNDAGVVDLLQGVAVQGIPRERPPKQSLFSCGSSLDRECGSGVS